MHTDWLRAIREEAQRIEATLNEHWVRAAAARARKLEESSTLPPFRTGDLVLCAKPFYERGEGLIIPQADGPFIIDQVFDGHTCRLRDAVSGAPYLNGTRISLARLVAFRYPVHAIQQEDPVVSSFDELRHGDLVAVETKLQQHFRVFVARIKTLFRANEQAEVDVFEVSQDQRYGGWNRRKWFPRTDAEGRVRSIVAVSYTHLRAHET